MTVGEIKKIVEWKWENRQKIWNGMTEQKQEETEVWEGEKYWDEWDVRRSNGKKVSWRQNVVRETVSEGERGIERGREREEGWDAATPSRWVSEHTF